MPKKLFTSEDWPIAQRIAEIVYCNVFEEKRWQLEHEILGDSYQTPRRFVAPGESERSLAPNMELLVEVAGTLLEKARTRLEVAAASDFSAKEVEAYSNVCHFFVFHKFMADIDELVHRSMRGGDSAQRVDFFFDARDEMRFYLGVSAQTRIDPEEEARYFAFYFQVRRAWLNTYVCLVGASSAITELRARIWRSCFTRDARRYQRSLYDRMGDFMTLITGPSGSGKELVARAIGLSRFVPFDAKSACFAADFGDGFYPLNLSALSPTLIESELFGHRKGAFTGALGDRKGYFEECGSHGSVFLDEIGETDPSIQVKLLRVLQTRQFQRLGETKLRPFVGKVMAATNRDLSEEMERGGFREDFYFRLNADRIQTPSLRAMLDGSEEELEILVGHIACRLAGPNDGEGLANESVDWIRKRMGLGYRWPGNFRELEQCVRSILIHGRYDPEPEMRASLGGVPNTVESVSKRLSANQVLSRYAQAIYREHGSYEETAKVMQVDRRTAKRYVLGVD